MTPALAILLNKVEDGFIPFCYMMPTRVIRVIADKSFCTFRVERLIFYNRDRYNPSGAWKTLATFGDKLPGAKCAQAMNAAIKAQDDLRAKLQKRMEAKR